ncbi:MAG: YeiH family protein [Acidimicrobiales bacterium]
MPHTPDLQTDLSERSATETSVPTVARRALALVPGLAMSVVLAVVATMAGNHFRVIGAPVFAIVGGMLISAFVSKKTTLHSGIAFSSKSVLKGSIIVLGTGLSFHEVIVTGVSSLPVLLGTLVVALASAWLLGRWLLIERDLTTLIGVGTAICGASAIAATDAVISASESDVSYAISTIFFFNVTAVLTFPALGHLMHLSSHAFGLWSGTAVNDMSSVVAASSVYSKAAASFAVIVKLTRTLMIIPITIGLASLRARRSNGPARSGASPSKLTTLRKVFPVFIIWFLVAVFANSMNWIGAAWHADLSLLASFMISVALGAIGMSSKFAEIRRMGARPLLMGGALWILVSASSLGLQLATTHLS